MTRSHSSVARGRAGVVMALVLIAASAASIQLGYTSTASAAALPNAALEADQGQYVPIQPYKILDTRDGVGESGGAAEIGPNGSVSDVPVLGQGQIPASGVSAVFISIQEMSATADGYITDYPSNVSNPGHASVSFQSGLLGSGSDTVLVAPPGSSGAGTISFTNNGSARIEMGAEVEGYFTDGTNSAPGDTYDGQPWTDLLDTRTGLGTSGVMGQHGPVAPLQPGATMKVAVDGANGVPASAIDAAEIEIGAINGSQSGYLDVSGQEGSALRSLSYNFYEKDRYTTILQPDSSGDVTIYNGGAGAVDVQVLLRGYFLFPAAALAGSEFVGMVPTTICDTRSGCSFNGGATTHAVPANGSINIQETGVSGVPSTEVAYVANEINAVAPDATGYLTVDPYGTDSPTTYAAVNFVGGDTGDATYDNTVISSTSISGAITVTNHSPGTVDVVVSARGYWTAPQAPDPPSGVQSSYSGGQATVTWNPGSDGGAAITSYTVTTTSGSTITVAGNDTVATLPAQSADQVSVYASNAVRSGSSSANVPVIGGTAQEATVSYPLTISGDFDAPDGITPASGVTVTIYPMDEVTQDEVSGSALPDGEAALDVFAPVTTNSLGQWSFTIPGFSSLAAAEQQEASANNGVINLLVDAEAFYDVAGSYVPISSLTSMPVFVGPGAYQITAPPTFNGTQTLQATFPNDYDLTAPQDNPPSTTDNTAADLASNANVQDITDQGNSANGKSVGEAAGGNGGSYLPMVSEAGTALEYGSVQPLTAIGSLSDTQIDDQAATGSSEKSFEHWANTCMWNGLPANQQSPSTQVGNVARTINEDTGWYTTELTPIHYVDAGSGVQTTANLTKGTSDTISWDYAPDGDNFQIGGSTQKSTTIASGTLQSLQDHQRAMLFAYGQYEYQQMGYRCLPTSDSEEYGGIQYWPGADPELASWVSPNPLWVKARYVTFQQFVTNPDPQGNSNQPMVLGGNVWQSDQAAVGCGSSNFACDGVSAYRYSKVHDKYSLHGEQFANWGSVVGPEPGGYVFSQGSTADNSFKIGLFGLGFESDTQYQSSDQVSLNPWSNDGTCAPLASSNKVCGWVWWSSGQNPALNNPGRFWTY